MTWSRGRLSATWLGDGLLVTAGARIAIDPGLRSAIALRGQRLDAVVLTGHTPEAIAGLVGVLSSTDGPLEVWAPLWDDRVGAFVEAWTRSFPREIVLESLGDRSNLCGLGASVRGVEIDGSPRGMLRLDHLDGRIVVSPTADAVRADLAVHRVEQWDRPSTTDVWAIRADGSWLSGPAA